MVICPGPTAIKPGGRNWFLDDRRASQARKVPSPPQQEVRIEGWHRKADILYCWLFYQELATLLYQGKCCSLLCETCTSQLPSFPSLPSPRSRSCFLRGKWWGTPASGTTARTLTHPFQRGKNKFIEQECTGLGLFRRAHEKQSGCNLRILRPHTNLMFCFSKDKDCLGQKAARPQTFFNLLWAGKLYWKEPMLLHSTTCPKTLPWGKPVHCDGSEGTHKHILVLGGKKSCHVSQAKEGCSQGDSKEGGYSTQPDPKPRNIYCCNSWMKHRTPGIIPCLTPVTPQMLCICALPVWSESRCKPPSLDTSVSPHVLQACFSCGSSTQSSFSIHGLGVLTDPFLLLRHCNPHNPSSLL